VSSLASVGARDARNLVPRRATPGGRNGHTTIVRNIVHLAGTIAYQPKTITVTSTSPTSARGRAQK
jgi:hypothetical protein